MNSKQNGKKLSHIITNVNKNIQNDSILSFCTNIKSKTSQIRFTYLSYDNHFPDEAKNVLCNLINTSSENKDSMFIITDSEQVIDYTVQEGIACAALNTAYNTDSDLTAVLYCIEDIEYMSFERINRMWQRHHGIPWTITETDRLVIREHTPEDIDALYEIYSDSEAARYMEDLYENREDEAEYLRQYIDNQYRFYEYGIWAVTLKDNGRLIGRAGISTREGFDLPEIGYIIGAPFRRCGYAKEAVRAVIDYGREELGLTDFMAFSKAKNIASANLLKNLGFRATGTATIKGGDHTMYILTKQQ